MPVRNKAIIAQVPFGEFTIEGLMLPNGEFAISVSQVAQLILVNQTHATRDIKALLGKDSNLSKTSSEISKRPVNYLTLDQFLIVLKAAAMKGVPEATNLIILLAGLSLNQLWCDAFGIRFEKEERQNWIKQRMIHQNKYHDRFTPWTKLDLAEAGITDKKLTGIEYGKRMNHLKLKAGLPLEFVGTYSSDQLQKINDLELQYHTLREAAKMSHSEAMNKI